MNILQICPPHLSDAATLHWENQKKSFFNIIIHIFQKKTSSNCYSAALGLRQRLVGTWAEFQHSVVYYATDQCRKRLEACIYAEGGHSEHCLPDSPVATHYNWFFSEPPMTTHKWLFLEPPMSERTQQTFSQVKKFCIHKLARWHFQVWWASGLQIVFLWDNVSNQKYVWILLLTMPFLDFPRYSGYIWQARWTICKIFLSCQIFSGFNVPKIIIIG